MPRPENAIAARASGSLGPMLAVYLGTVVPHRRHVCDVPKVLSRTQRRAIPVGLKMCTFAGCVAQCEPFSRCVPALKGLMAVSGGCRFSWNCGWTKVKDFPHRRLRYGETLGREGCDGDRARWVDSYLNELGPHLLMVGHCGCDVSHWAGDRWKR